MIVQVRNWTITGSRAVHLRAFIKISNWIDGRFSPACDVCQLIFLLDELPSNGYSLEKINGFSFLPNDRGDRGNTSQVLCA